MTWEAAGRRCGRYKEAARISVMKGTSSVKRSSNSMVIRKYECADHVEAGNGGRVAVIIGGGRMGTGPGSLPGNPRIHALDEGFPRASPEGEKLFWKVNKKDRRERLQQWWIDDRLWASRIVFGTAVGNIGKDPGTSEDYSKDDPAVDNWGRRQEPAANHLVGPRGGKEGSEGRTDDGRAKKDGDQQDDHDFTSKELAADTRVQEKGETPVQPSICSGLDRRMILKIKGISAYEK